MQIHLPDDRTILPWERQPGEGSPAYRAFCAYRDLAPEPLTGARSLAAAYNTLRPPEKRLARDWAPKEWKGWAEKWQWKERVAQWDQHLDRIRQKGVEKVVQQQGERWAQASEKIREKALKVGMKLLEQADLLSQFPVVRQTVRENGSVTVWEPIGAKDLKEVAAIAQAGRDLAAGAAAEGTRAAEQMRDTPAEPDEARKIRERADLELQEWQQQQIAKQGPRIALEPPAPGSMEAERG